MGVSVLNQEMASRQKPEVCRVATARVTMFVGFGSGRAARVAAGVASVWHRPCLAPPFLDFLSWSTPQLAYPHITRALNSEHTNHIGSFEA